jgi:hypothetical protein
LVFGLKVEFKYTRRNTAISGLFGIYTREIIENAIKIAQRDIKATYRLMAALLFWVERYIAPDNARR